MSKVFIQLNVKNKDGSVYGYIQIMSNKINLFKKNAKKPTRVITFKTALRELLGTR